MSFIRPTWSYQVQPPPFLIIHTLNARRHVCVRGGGGWARGPMPVGAKCIYNKKQERKQPGGSDCLGSRPSGPSRHNICSVHYAMYGVYGMYIVYFSHRYAMYGVHGMYVVYFSHSPEGLLAWRAGPHNDPHTPVGTMRCTVCMACLVCI